MVNGGNDVRTLFKTGDAIEFELRTRPDNDDKQVIDGDLRCSSACSRRSRWRCSTATRFRARSNPVEFTSPVSTTRIDRVEVLADAQIAVDRSPAGYSVRAAVPLAALHFAPAVGKTYRGDIGIVYSDKTGAIDELHMYWANPVNGMVNDLSTEARITPATWGRFTVEE